MECHHITWVCLVYQKHWISYPSSSFKSQWDVFLGFVCRSCETLQPLSLWKESTFFWRQICVDQLWNWTILGKQSWRWDLSHLFHLLCISLSLMKKLMAKTLQGWKFVFGGGCKLHLENWDVQLPRGSSILNFQKGGLVFWLTGWPMFLLGFCIVASKFQTHPLSWKTYISVHKHSFY